MSVASLHCDDVTGRPPDLARSAQSLPPRADRPVEIPTRQGPVLRAWLEGARATVGVVRGEIAEYAGASPDGATLFRARRRNGVEDLVHHEVEPAVERARFHVSTEGFAGLRLVAGVVEWVDASGAPRARMSRPRVRDAQGRMHPARTAVDDCDVDRDPRPPWGRAPTPPGAATCTIAIDWNLDASDYPATLDPLWTTTEDLVQARAGHTATTLRDGRILLAGGNASDVDLDDVEIFDPATETFAVTSSLREPRRQHAAVVRPQGDVLMIGGIRGFLPGIVLLTSVERFDEETFEPVAAPPMLLARVAASHTPFDDGVLVVGGTTFFPTAVRDEVEVVTWSGDDSYEVAPLPVPSSGHAAFAFDRILVAGGNETDDPPHATSFVYDPLADVWSEGPTLSRPRTESTPVLLGDGRWALVGGTTLLGGYGMLDDVDVYDPVADTFSLASVLVAPRWLHGATLLPNGRILITGTTGPGYATSIEHRIEVVDLAQATSSALGNLPSPLSGHSSTLLADGRTLVAGGSYASGPFQTNRALLVGDAFGTACDLAVATDCLNGFCVDGVCAAEPGQGGGGTGGSGDGSGGAGAAGAAGGADAATAGSGPQGDGGGGPDGPVSASNGTPSTGAVDAGGGDAPSLERDDESFFGCGVASGASGRAAPLVLLLAAATASGRRRRGTRTGRQSGRRYA